jgi:hypothetical protein
LPTKLDRPKTNFKAQELQDHFPIWTSGCYFAPGGACLDEWGRSRESFQRRRCGIYVVIGCWRRTRRQAQSPCRLRETRLPMNCIDFKENKITFPTPKGGEDRAFSIPMPSALRPLFERLRKTKHKFTVEFPFQPSRRWQQFFIKINKPHLCFHCLRVTYVNRLRRAGAPREAAMRLVNHSSELIHQVYQREKVEDVAQWRDAVQFN